MSKPKQNPASSNYIETIREGAIAANIFRGNTPDGFTYLYFEISRSWKSQSGNRKGYSAKFYDRNAEAISRVAMEAARWVEKVRVNPGNYADRKKFQVREYTDEEYAAELKRIEEEFGPLVDLCRERGVACESAPITVRSATGS